MAITTQSAHDALRAVVEPETGKSLTELNLLQDLEVNAAAVSLTVASFCHAYPHREAVEAALKAALEGAGAKTVEVTWNVRINTRDIQSDDPCPGAKNIILVMSGKGGVGKSSVATNLTVALSSAGAKVGLLDADLYGPSIPTMFGVSGRPASADGKRMLPLERFGIKLMSLGFLLEDAKQAVIWRGPMLQSALLQFLGDVDWGELDYLILDLPPGTGDIALTISQKLKTTGAIVVTTPQEVALQDVYKSVAMAQRVGIPLLGVVENESYFICDGCEKRHEIFGRGGGQAVADFAEAPLLGQLPLDPTVRQWGDAGTPVTRAAPDSPIAKAFVELSAALACRVGAHNAKRGGGLKIDRSGGKQKFLPVTR